MQRITAFIAKETSGVSFKTNKYTLDRGVQSIIDYDDAENNPLKRSGETPNQKGTINLTNHANVLKGKAPLFRYFLDGSRRTYKVDDIIYNNKVFPVIAGQIGVGCCQRIQRQIKRYSIENEKIHVIVLPETSDKDGYKDNYFESLRKKICAMEVLKKRNIVIHKVLYYKESKKDDEKYDDLGVAKIQDEMIEMEKKAVAELAKGDKLDNNAYLLKDGSLEYKIMGTGNYKDIAIIKTNYRWVVGASKSFNPEKCKDIQGNVNASGLAKLPLYHRTPACLYESKISGSVKFAIWYVRIREAKYSYSPFDGILKLEKILITADEEEKGLETEELNHITANIINERNPVAYGSDTRWANHLYPVFLTETFIKSKYLSSEYFLNLF
ncbi:MAG: hypothetical protein LBK43_02985 [Treponema sp.]|jgi:hypothetical protein|nr:hypothetical protein [Treponema sp.]